jgi:hypothetical protein
MISASSGLRALSNSRKRKRIDCLPAIDKSRHTGNAFFAEDIAAWISAEFANATSFVCTPRAGS